MHIPLFVEIVFLGDVGILFFEALPFCFEGNTLFEAPHFGVLPIGVADECGGDGKQHRACDDNPYDGNLFLHCPQLRAVGEKRFSPMTKIITFTEERK